MLSAWSDSVKLPHFHKLTHDIQTDVLIIGGGMAGILCAYYLDRAGVSYVLAEADEICSGITKNTTAKITAQHGLIYDKIVSKFGIENARMYLQANLSALEEYRRLCKHIDCDFESKDSYVYSLDSRDKIELEISALDKIGYRAKLAEHLPLPFDTAGAVKFEHQAQFNPLKFISAIAENLNIYEHTTVRELIGTTAVTDGGKIQANKIIVATHFPFINKHGSYFLKMYQHRSYVLALENAPDVQGMYVDEKETGLSFRNYKDLLLIGGGDHRTGKKGGSYHQLTAFTNEYYPDFKERYRWATQDCMTLDSVPYIGHYSARTSDMFVATGFNKWGMTSSMVSAMILTDMILERENPYQTVFSPSRSILHPQLAVNAVEAVTNLLTFSTKRCPHLGCALKWNKNERTWDCPCHGSRFDQHGHLIDNPATGDLK